MTTKSLDKARVAPERPSQLYIPSSPGLTFEIVRVLTTVGIGALQFLGTLLILKRLGSSGRHPQLKRHIT
ncbi:unnamed protein product [Schistosoma curassoni]|uniref:Conserved membrane protein n=1 Tax=Schistosoma curassoni TaxID=6186 RepID=A0A183JM36_9TREM|nr:unnamed protein product [Schistosoma curassoni]